MNKSSSSIFLKILTVVAISEVFVMWCLSAFAWRSRWILFIDPLLQISIISPLIYLFVIKPLSELIRNLVQSENALLQSQNRYRQVVEGTRDLVTIVDGDGRFTYVNPLSERILGVEDRKALGMSSFDFVHQNDREKTIQWFETCIRERTKHASIINSQVNVSSRAEYNMLWTCHFDYDAKGQIIEVRSISQDITDRIKVEENLKEQNYFLKNVIDSIPHPFIVIDVEDYSILHANTSAQQLSDSEADTCYKLTHHQNQPCNQTACSCPIHEAKRTKCPVVLEHVHFEKNGDKKIIEVHAYPIFDVDGNISTLIEHMIDITERRKIEEKLQESEERFRMLFKRAPINYQSLDENGCILDVNDTWLQTLGYNRDQIIGRKFVDFVAPESREKLRCNFPQLKKTGKQDNVELQLLPKDGREVLVLLTGRISLNEEGIFQRSHCVLHDITARKKAEIDLLKQQAFLQKSQEIGNIGTWELDVPSNRLTWTDENYRIFGIPIGSSLTYETFLEQVYPEDRESVNDEWEKALRGKPYDIEHRLLVYGKVKWVREKAELIFDDSNNCILATGVTQDITSRMMREQSLKESEERFRTLFENAPLGYQSLDENGNFIEINETWCKALGYKKQEVLGKNFSEFLHPSYRAQYKRRFLKFKKRGFVQDVEYKMLRKDGTEIFMLFDGKIARNDDGSFRQTHCVLQDITEKRTSEEERRKLEAQVQHSQKLESLGVLAGGIAHDFNNMLAAIMGFSEFAREDAEDGSDMQQNLDEVIKASNRAASLVQQILTFSQRTQTERKILQLQPIIQEALALIRGSIPTTIEIQEDLSENCDVAHVDPTQIHQIIMNLCTNAYHAMQDTGGVLTVRLDEDYLDAASVMKYENLVSGRYAHLSISDTGHGMDKETMARIFEPYFTTKDKSKGSGLGLATVYGIIRSYQGDILVSSQQGVGTTFDIFLPICEAETHVETGAIIEPENLKGNERIMFVDDEPALTRVATLMLEPLGYHIQTFTSSLDAQDAFICNPQAFDIIITDFTMPKMTGLDMSTNLLAIRPDIPIIICSGYSESLNAEKAEVAGIRRLLKKPLSRDNLARNTRQVLDEKNENMQEHKGSESNDMMYK